MQQDIWELNINQNHSIRPYLQMLGNQLEVAASPDGRCIAYLSEQGAEGYALILKPIESETVRVIPQPTVIRNIRWSGDGSELFFLDGKVLKSMRIHWEPTFQ